MDRRPGIYFTSILENQNRLFWLLQLSGWFALSLLTYVSLTLPYDQVQLQYVLHNIFQSCVGVAVSTPLRYVSRAAWEMKLWRRLVTVITATLLLALIWSVLRLAMFLLLTDETGLWADFGGWFYPSIFVFMCWIALYHGIKFYQLFEMQRANLLKLESHQRAESLRTVSLEHAAKEAQLTLLRYQLNPHFLFNTLNSVAALIDTDNRSKAKYMLISLSQFLRYSLRSDISKNYRLSDEIDAIEQYLNIEQIRFADRLRVEKQVDPYSLDCKIPGFILQPLIENAIKYAVAREPSGGAIRVSSLVEGGRLRLSVADTGTSNGVAEERSPSGEGVGLNNIRERLATIFGSEAALEIGASDLGGWSVEITMPCEKAES